MLNQIIQANPLVRLGNTLFSNSDILSNLAQYLGKLFINTQQSNIQKLLFGFGVGAITYKILYFVVKQIIFWSWLPGHLRRNIGRVGGGREWKQKYGDCYVVVTGAADGIGYAYVREFAKMEFNMILVDIQEQKLQTKKKQLHKMFPLIKIQIVAIDMSDNKKMGEFISMLHKFDIGIVINNVGLAGGGPYMQITPTIIKKTLNINFLPCFTINRSLIPKMRRRSYRSAIINMSSGTGVHFSHNLGTYSSIKYLVDIYSRTLSREHHDKIDIMSVRPFAVKTSMLKMKARGACITPKQCVVGALRDLGYGDASFAQFSHKVQGAYFGTLGWEKRLEIFEEFWKGNK